MNLERKWEVGKRYSLPQKGEFFKIVAQLWKKTGTSIFCPIDSTELHYLCGNVLSVGPLRRFVTKSLQILYEGAYLPHCVQALIHNNDKCRGKHRTYLLKVLPLNATIRSTLKESRPRWQSWEIPGSSLPGWTSLQRTLLLSRGCFFTCLRHCAPLKVQSAADPRNQQKEA